jgi:hypothetical protein
MTSNELKTLIAGLSEGDRRQLRQEVSDKRIAEETFRLAYKEYGDQIRHFSAVRSALTTFLLTVALASFSAYFTSSPKQPFLVAAGFIFSLAAVAACVTFSFRTEKSVLRYKDMWAFLGGEKSMDLEILRIHESKSRTIWKKVGKDPLNWLLLAGVAGMIVSFCKRDQLESYFRSIGLL